MRIYADNAATTRMSQTAIDAMVRCMEDQYGNPSSLYTIGQQAKEALERARSRNRRPLPMSPNRRLPPNRKPLPNRSPLPKRPPNLQHNRSHNRPHNRCPNRQRLLWRIRHPYRHR